MYIKFERYIYFFYLRFVYLFRVYLFSLVVDYLLSLVLLWCFMQIDFIFFSDYVISFLVDFFEVNLVDLIMLFSNNQDFFDS